MFTQDQKSRNIKTQNIRNSSKNVQKIFQNVQKSFKNLLQVISFE